ncbi:MAG TPA: carbohydrate binding domain-containing protein [Candidatus Limnocylindrales bacterium]|nr:carbohydrate binding domain-containing protein [Candidatus Limnocylindrales bacterium]
MKDKKYENIIPIVTLIVGAILGALFPTMLVPNIEPVYNSDLIIKQQGANYSSAQWEFHIQPEKKYFYDSPKESWAFFDMDVRNIENDFNLSDFKGVSFYISGNVENKKIQFNLFTHNFTNGNHEVYQYWNNGNLLVTTNWRKEEILFSSLNATPSTEKWYPNEPKNPNLEKVFAMGFAANTTVPMINKIAIDEMYLIYKNGSKMLLTNFNTLNVSINGVEGIWYAGVGHL